MSCVQSAMHTLETTEFQLSCDASSLLLNDKQSGDNSCFTSGSKLCFSNSTEMSSVYALKISLHGKVVM
jgi:phosphoribosyl-AMP cyclohydrolase